MHDSHAPAVGHPHAEGGHAAPAAHHPHVRYGAIFVALCVCTLVSAGLDLLPWNRRTVAVLVLAVAVAKAQYVMRYFMHLKFEGKWKYVLLLPTAILACGVPLALAPDIGLHYYRMEVPQMRHESTARGAHGDHAAPLEEPAAANGSEAPEGH